MVSLHFGQWKGALWLKLDFLGKPGQEIEIRNVPPPSPPTTNTGASSKALQSWGAPLEMVSNLQYNAVVVFTIQYVSIFVINGRNWELWWSRNGPWWLCLLGTPPDHCQAKRLKQRLVNVPLCQMQLHRVQIYRSSYSLSPGKSCRIKTEWTQMICIFSSRSSNRFPWNWTSMSQRLQCDLIWF